LATKKLSKLGKPQQDYYIFLAKECFAGMKKAYGTYFTLPYQNIIW
jgi:hypothetical protein